MSTDRNSNRNVVGLGVVGVSTLKAIAQRCRATSEAMRQALAGLCDPRLRADIHGLIDAYRTGRAPEPTPLPTGRAEALATVCESLLQQFDDENAGAAEIRLVVHKRDEVPNRPGSAPRPDSRHTGEAEDQELVWELRRLLASSGGSIADVAHALERRGDDVDRKGRELLQDEVRAVEVDIAVLKTLLSDYIDWDAECRHLLAGEVPPFEDRAADDDLDDEDD